MSTQRRVLIVSNHPLFGQGLRRLLQIRPEADAVVVGVVANIREAIAAIETHDPDLVVVDYDDEAVNRDEFLTRFVEGDRRLRVVLLSLKEGGSEAIIYDRRSMAASQIDDWLEAWADAPRQQPPAEKEAPPSLRGDGFTMKNNARHFIGAAIFVIILTAIGLLILRNDLLLPPPASAQARPIDFIFDVQWKLIAFLFALIAGTILYSLVVFRRKPDDTTDADHITGDTRLEVAWTVVPLGIVIGLSLISSQALAETQRIDPQALEVNVIGQQWSWRFEYPDSGVVSTELVLPVDQQVALKLSSLDVIHSFWVPEFRLKQDAVPGQEKTLRITPDREGVFTMMCAEVCGTRHYAMNATVRVVSAADYQAWLGGQVAAIPQDPVASGQKWAEQNGCLGCHSLDGTALIGPTFKGLYGKTEYFEDGSSRLVDDAYLLEAIRDPQASIVKGYPPIMQASSAAGLTDEQIQDIIALIQSLK